MLKKSIGRDVRIHLKEVLKSQNKLSRENLKSAVELWKEKEEVFFSTVRHLGLCSVQKLKGSASGFLIFTLSGSIIAFSPSQSDKRSVVYFNTGVQTGGPKNRIFDNIKIASPVRKGEELLLEGELKRTSRIYHIAVFPEDVAADVQKRTLYSLSETSQRKDNRQPVEE